MKRTLVNTRRSSGAGRGRAGNRAKRSAVSGQRSARGGRPSDIAYEASRTNRLNEDHWAWASRANVNAALLPELDIIRQRTALELRNNPDAIGIAMAFADDLIGGSGPTVGIEVADDGYDQFIDQVQNDLYAWFQTCDVTTGGDFTDMLWTGVWGTLREGSFPIQQITDARAPGPVKLGLLPLSACRIVTPPEYAGDDRVRGGVRVDENGRPIEYYVLAEHPGEALLGARWGQYRTISAEELHQYFLRMEFGQVTGVPRLTSVLEHFRSQRAADDAVIRAVQMAAILSAFITNSTDSGAPAPTSESSELDQFPLETMIVRELAAGQDLKQVTPQQPHPQYGELQAQMHGRSGRPIGMPRARVTGDAAGHTYSSLRAIRAMYGRALKREQWYLFRGIIRWVCKAWFDEYLLAMGAGLVPQVAIPPRWEFTCAWEPQEELDPLKASQSREIRLRTFIADITDIWREDGNDPRKMWRKVARSIRMMREAGLTRAAATDAAPEDQQSDREDPENEEGRE